VLLAAVAYGVEPSGSKFDGQWSLELQISTKPGGETLQAAGAVTSPIHIQIRAANPSFTVDDSGKFSWDSRDCGRSHVAKHAAYTGGGTSDTSEQTRVLLKVQGSVSERRVLTIDPQWTSGNGQLWTTTSTGAIFLGCYSVSGDGSSISISTSGNLPGDYRTYTLPIKYQGAPWTLSPTSIEQHEISADVIREVAKYRAQRQGTYAGAVPVIERLEIKQVRNLELVPRG
jgi:hypothetical protein